MVADLYHFVFSLFRGEITKVKRRRRKDAIFNLVPLKDKKGWTEIRLCCGQFNGFIKYTH